MLLLGSNKMRVSYLELLLPRNNRYLLTDLQIRQVYLSTF